MKKITNHYPFAALDAFVIMPNHMHVVVIDNRDDNVEPLHCNGLQRDVFTTIETISLFFPIFDFFYSCYNIMTKFKNRYRIGSARLKHWNYAWNGAYFITICTADRKCYFGDVVEGNMHLSNTGKIAHNFWQEIPDHFPLVILDAFLIMPNHMHGIIIIDNDDVEPLHCNGSTCNGSTDQSNIPNKNKFMSNISPKPGSVSTIIRSYKSVVTKHARKINAAFAWQSRFYDHIIRNDQSYERIKQYINDNPENWEKDRFYS